MAQLNLIFKNQFQIWMTDITTKKKYLIVQQCQIEHFFIEQNIKSIFFL